MTQWIAMRRLLYSQKGRRERRELLVRISTPYKPDASTLSFPIDEETACCSVEIAGLDYQHFQETYGADSLQALQLAVNVEPMLKRLSNKYDLFFPSGEPYFDAQEEDE